MQPNSCSPDPSCLASDICWSGQDAGDDGARRSTTTCSSPRALRYETIGSKVAVARAARPSAVMRAGAASAELNGLELAHATVEFSSRVARRLTLGQRAAVSIGPRVALGDAPIAIRTLAGMRRTAQRAALDRAAARGAAAAEFGCSGILECHAAAWDHRSPPGCPF